MMFAKEYRSYSTGVHVFIPEDEVAFTKDESTHGFRIIYY